MRSAGRGGRCSCSIGCGRSPAWCSRGSCLARLRRCSCGRRTLGSPRSPRGRRGRRRGKIDRFRLILQGREIAERNIHRSGDPLRSLALRGFLRFPRKWCWPPAADGEHQRDQVHQHGGRGLQPDQAQGQQVLDRVGIGLHRPGGGCGHQFCGVKPPTGPTCPCPTGFTPRVYVWQTPLRPSSGQAQG